MRKSIAKVERRAHYNNFDIGIRLRKEVQHSFVKELDKKLFILYNDEKWMFLSNFLHTRTSFAKKWEKPRTRHLNPFHAVLRLTNLSPPL